MCAQRSAPIASLHGFGIVYVDFPTQRRIVKASGQFVSRVAATNGGYLQEVVTGSE